MCHKSQNKSSHKKFKIEKPQDFTAQYFMFYSIIIADPTFPEYIKLWTTCPNTIPGTVTGEELCEHSMTWDLFTSKISLFKKESLYDRTILDHCWPLP